MASSSSISVPSALRTEQLHNLPIKLAQNSQLASQEQFIQQLEEGSTEAYLRGRLLRGVTVELPAGYTGVVVRPGSTQSDECQREWTATAAFRSFVSWSHDTAPAQTDPVRRALDWCSLSAQVHTPISLADVEAELRLIQGAS